MPRREQMANQFYEDPGGLTLPLYMTSPTGLVISDTPALKHQESIDSAEVDDKLAELNRNLFLLECGGSTFEVGVLNQDAPDEGAMLHISTYSSSLTGNVGNAYEFAAQAVRYPNHRQIYVASFGNGGTSRLLTHKERRYFAHTGRLTWKNDGKIEPLPSIQNLHGALTQAELPVTRIMGSDSAGGSYASALSVAMEEGQLTHAFFSERTGFVNLQVIPIIYKMLYKEKAVNHKHNQAITTDPEALTGEMKERAKTALAQGEDTPERRELAENTIPLALNVLNMWTSMQALRRGPRWWSRRNPIVAETNIMLERHPSTKITFGMAEEDPLYKSPERARRAAQDFLGKISVQHAPVRVVMIPGMSHAYNTDFPSLYHAIKRYALEL